MVKKKKALLISCSLIFFLTGCWDQVSIEERGFVIGVSVDLKEKTDGNNYKLTMTEQLVVPAGLGSPGQSGGATKPFTNITASGKSIFEISRKMAKQISRVPYYEHLKVIIISEEVAKAPRLFSSIMDIFIRDQEMRRSIKVVISEGKAKKLLEIKPASENLPAVYIESVMENNAKSIEVGNPVKMGNIHQFLLDRSSFSIPRVVPDENRLKTNGLAVFHGNDNKMIGMLNGKETKGLNLIKEKNKGGSVKFEIEDHLMVYEFQHTKSAIKIDVKNKDDITISIDIDAEGSVAEMFGSETLLKAKRFKEIEKKVSEKIEQLANQTIEKVQGELKADIFGFDNLMKQRHYDKWQKIKKNWDTGENIFANCKIKVSAKAYIRATGSSDKTKDKGKE